MPTAVESKPGRATYFTRSKDLLTSLILVLPLLLIYQAGLLATRGATLNGADFATVVILGQWGWDGLLVFNGLLIVGGIAGVIALRRKGGFDAPLVGWVALESTFYALLLGFVITQTLYHLGVRPPGASIQLAAQGSGGLLTDICLALGAGVNEELVFRLGLFSGLVALLQGPLGKEKAVVAGVALSSVLFSLAHYLGPTEHFAMYTFLYRTLAGLLFCALFHARGLAVAVYTHAIYDVIVMVLLKS